MTDIPSSLKITPTEARTRFQSACEYLVSAVGCVTIASRLNVHRGTVLKWASGRNEARYSDAIFIIAWSDLERGIEDECVLRKGSEILAIKATAT